MLPNVLARLAPSTRPKARGIRGVGELANHERRHPDRAFAGQSICLVVVAGFEPTASSVRFATYTAFHLMVGTGIHLRKRRLAGHTPSSPIVAVLQGFRGVNEGCKMRSRFAGARLRCRDRWQLEADEAK